MAFRERMFAGKMRGRFAVLAGRYEQGCSLLKMLPMGIDVGTR
jgi:hypothetical protein